MSAKSSLPCALVLAVLGASLAYAGDDGGIPPIVPPGTDLHRVPAHIPPGENVPPDTLKRDIRQSDWILGDRPECCGPVGKDGPVTMEVYLRNGTSSPIGGGLLSDVIGTGWMLQGGGRTLFFNATNDRAWTIDLNITNVANWANKSAANAIAMTDVLVPRPTDPANPTNPNPPGLPAAFQSPPYPQQAAIPVDFGADNFGTFIPGLSLTSLNRTFVSAGVGREWYIGLPANLCDGGWMWRVGADVGGRWGTTKANFKEIRHRTDVIHGVYAALHSDLEAPCGGCCKFQLGLRTEWDWTWMYDIIRPNSGDISELNVLITTGVRF